VSLLLTVDKTTKAEEVLFSLHAIKGSSLQIGAVRVAKAVCALEKQNLRDRTDVALDVKRLEAEFTGFVQMFEDYICESIRFPPVVDADPPEFHKSSSSGAPSIVPAAEHDNNLLSQSM